MKITKKILIASLTISPLTALAFIPNVVKNANLKQYSLNSEENIVFFSPKKENFIGLPKTFKYCKELFEPKTLKAFPLWCFVERLDSFDGVHYFSDYANDLSKVLDVKYDDIVPNGEKANYVNVSQFINKKIDEIIKHKIKTKEVDFVLKDYKDNVNNYHKSKEMFYENIGAFLNKIEKEIYSQLLKFEKEYKDIVLKEKYEYIEKLEKELVWMENHYKELGKNKPYDSMGRYQPNNAKKWEKIKDEYNTFCEEIKKLKNEIKNNYESINKIKLIE